MSKLAWAALLFAGAAVGLVAYLMTRPLPDYHRELALKNEATMAQRAAEFTAEEKALAEVIAEDPAYLEPVAELAAAKAELAERKGKLAALQQRFDAEVKPILEANDYDDKGKLYLAISDVMDPANQITVPTPTPADQARTFLRYKKDHAQLVQAAEGKVQSAQPGDIDIQAAAVNRAVLACPSAKDKLEARLAALQKLRGQLMGWAPKLAQLKAQSPPDYIAVGKLTDQIAETHAAWTAGRVKLREALATLEQSEDRVLVDMKKEGGQAYHKVNTYLDGHEQKGDWSPVDAATYARHRDHLGMAIYSKPACTLADEAVTVASPPGYSYIGNPRYGRWETRGGDRFWVFYGQYALMRDLLWGRGYYRPVRYSTWNSYDTARRSGRTWYGPKREYGSNGTRTRTRYAGSKYVTTNRKRSYSGSRYQGSSGSRSSSGTRSGNYRSSRYRSRSFGGSGK